MAHAEPEVIHLRNEILPKTLYHWIWKHQLSDDWRLITIRTKKELPLPWIQESHLISEGIKRLAGRNGLFVWTHPVTGLGTDPTEIYGDVPIQIKTKPEPARVLTVITADGHLLPIAKATLDQVDAIHHYRMEQLEDGQWVRLWEEWILLNPKAVERFSADPRDIKPILSRSIKKIENGEVFPRKVLHIFVPTENLRATTLPLFQSRSDLKRIVLPILKKYMRLSEADFPIEWRRNYQGLKSCHGLRQLGELP